MYMGELPRYREIDVARGIAIVMMVLYHTLFDLSFFRVVSLEVSEGFWRYFAFATATLFLLVVGISLTISHSRVTAGFSSARIALKYVKRGTGIFFLGLFVTLGTWLYLREGFIVFGILHLIGVSIVLSPLFFRFKKWNTPLGLLWVLAGGILAQMEGPAWLLPLGVHPVSFWSVDYEPLFPWFGCVLIGMGLGEYLYPKGLRGFTPPRVPGIIEQPLAFLGKNSLIIYLVHQPVIIFLIAAVTGVKVW